METFNVISEREREREIIRSIFDDILSRGVRKHATTFRRKYLFRVETATKTEILSG